VGVAYVAGSTLIYPDGIIGVASNDSDEEGYVEVLLGGEK